MKKRPMFKMCCLLICLLLNLMPTPSNASFFDEHAKGWFWYQDFLEDKNTQAQNLPPKANLNPSQQMQAYQKSIEQSLNRAILSPTQENLKIYAQNYFDVIQRAQKFTDAYQMMILKNPHFDYLLKFPINPSAQQVYVQQKEHHLQAAIRDFAKHNGFFFFFSPHCRYCHLFAPIVKAFAEKYHIAVLAINLEPDQPNLREFPHAIPDNGASRLFKVTYLPSLFVVNPKTRDILPIANGFVHLEQLEENLFRFIASQQNNALNQEGQDD